MILIPVACVSAIRAIKSNRNDVSDWLPKDYDETRELAWFRKHFVADQFVLISWDGATLGEDPTGADDDPRIAKLVDELKKARMTRIPRPANRFRSSRERHHHRPHGAAAADGAAQRAGPPSGDRATHRVAHRARRQADRRHGHPHRVGRRSNSARSIGRPVKRFGLIKHKPSPIFKALDEGGHHRRRGATGRSAGRQQRDRRRGRELAGAARRTGRAAWASACRTTRCAAFG